MKRPLALLLAVSMLAFPSAALAQSAGDEQYDDPFGEVEEPSGSQEPAPAEEPAPAPTPTEPSGSTGEEAVASQQADAPTLPVTGTPAHLLAGAGLSLLASGAALRRRAL